jgi:hypothetical protein
MSRILFAWELGANLGHLSRDVPVAELLREAGHDIAFAVRDTRVASEILAPRHFNFIQSPIFIGRVHLAAPPANYAELLEAEGWCDRIALKGHLRAWLSIFSIGEFDAVVADHAPGSLVAAHISGRIGIALGNGFEIPPDIEPMPTIRPWQQYSEDRLMASERRVLADINAVVKHLGGKSYARLGEMFPANPILTTFAELDHYGQRDGAFYVGSIHGLSQALEVSWHAGGSHRIVAYLRIHHQATVAVMEALAESNVCAICVIPDATELFKTKYQSNLISIVEQPIALDSLLENADALIGYASAGVMAATLLKGVPLLSIPSTVEQYLGAKRVEAIGAGILIDGTPNKERISEAIASLLNGAHFKDKAHNFAKRYAQFTPKSAASEAAQHVIELLASQGKGVKHTSNIPNSVIPAKAGIQQ